MQHWGLHKLPLASRLAIGFGLVLALVLAMASIGAFALSRSIGLHEHASAMQAVRQQVHALAMEVALDEVRTLAVIRSAGMPEVMEPFTPAMQASAKTVAQSLASLREAGADAIEPAALQPVQAAHANFLKSRDEVLRLVETGQTIQANDAITQRLTPARQAWAQAVGALGKQMDARASQASTDADRLGAQAKWALLVMAVAATALGVGWSMAVSRSIARPISTAVQVSTAIARGDLDSQVAGSGHRSAEGGETGQLLRSLLTMRSALATVSRENAETAVSVARASETMSQSAQSLAIRTEEQTQGVQAARAKVSDVAEQIKQTARLAEEGQAHCVQLQGATRQCHLASTEAADTMGRVAARSKDMAEVVALIEAIAFQINLLSLNAAVEAARAGESGSGFAVVAGEVRRLAGRATESAGAIRQLIQGTNAQLQDGVASVKRVATELTRMHGMVEAVASRATLIRDATSDQTAALAEASGGLIELVRLNSANAEMVINTVHGCESLRSEAEMLLARIARMRTDSADGIDPAAALSAAQGTRDDSVDFF